jgi:hypothetical protein
MSGNASRGAEPASASSELCEARNRIGMQVWRVGTSTGPQSRTNLGNRMRQGFHSANRSNASHCQQPHDARPRRVELWLDGRRQTVSLPARSAGSGLCSNKLTFDDVREAILYQGTIEGGILSRWICKLVYRFAKFDD